MTFASRRPAPLLALALILFGCCTALSQDKLISKKLNQETTFGPIADVKHIDNLGEILLDGYSSGKLRGYTSAVIDSVTSWKVVTDFPAWEKTTYYDGDLVTHSGKVYRSIADDNNDTPGNSKKWKADEVKEPASHLMLFPALKDTLSKKEFFNRTVLVEAIYSEPWSSSVSYVMTDRVSYNGQSYEALKDVGTSRQNPQVDTQNWQQVENGVLFVNRKDFNDITMSFNYSVRQSDTTWVPEMVSVNTFDPNMERLKPVCHFYYKDVMEYLQTVSQPSTTIFKYGYLGNSLFEFNESAISECVALLKADTGWKVFQQPSTRELKLYKPGSKEPIKSIPLKTVEPILKKQKLIIPAIKNYSSLLSEKAVSTKTEYNFIEEYKLQLKGELLDLVPGIVHSDVPAEFTHLTIIYEKNFTAGKSLPGNYFTPLTLNIIYDTKSDKGLVVSYDWNDLKKSLQKSAGKFNAFIDVVEKGSLDFTSAEILYGLKEK